MYSLSILRICGVCMSLEDSSLLIVKEKILLTVKLFETKREKAFLRS